jgi:hypothetical protein
MLKNSKVKIFRSIKMKEVFAQTDQKFGNTVVSLKKKPISCENNTSLYDDFLKEFKTYNEVNDLIDFQSSGYNKNSIFIQISDYYLKKRPDDDDVSLFFIPLNKEYKDAKYVTPTPDEKIKFCEGEDNEGEDDEEEEEEANTCCIKKFVGENIILTPAETINDDIYNLFKIGVSNGQKYDGTNFRIFFLIRIPYDDKYFYQYIEPNNTLSSKECFQASSIFNVYNNDNPTLWTNFLIEEPSIDKDNNKITLSFKNEYLKTDPDFNNFYNLVDIWFLERTVKDIKDIKVVYCDNEEYKKKALYNNNTTTFIYQITQIINDMKIDTNGYTGVNGDIKMYVRLRKPGSVDEYIGSFYV